MLGCDRIEWNGKIGTLWVNVAQQFRHKSLNSQWLRMEKTAKSQYSQI